MEGGVSEKPNGVAHHNGGTSVGDEKDISKLDSSVELKEGTYFQNLNISVF